LCAVEDEQVRFEQGSIWTFDNLKMHAIANDGDVDPGCCHRVDARGMN
jgi:hypothetical protein